jgi:acetyl-CoA synthetase
LEINSNKVANLLLNLGATEGDRVFTFFLKSPDVYFIFLGILKVRAVAGILFANFGEEALLDRLKDCAAKILFTNGHSLRKIKAIWSQLPELMRVIVVDASENESDQIMGYSHLMTRASDNYETPITSPDTPSVLHYTSGSTGKPKGVLHVHGSFHSQEATFNRILSVQHNDIYWCTADPGWVTGVSYGIIGPFSQGVTQILFGRNLVQHFTE